MNGLGCVWWRWEEGGRGREGLNLKFGFLGGGVFLGKGLWWLVAIGVTGAKVL